MYSALTSEIFVRSDSKIVGADSKYIALIQKKLTIYLYSFLRYLVNRRTDGRTDRHGSIDFCGLSDHKYIYMSIPISSPSVRYNFCTNTIYPK